MKNLLTIGHNDLRIFFRNRTAGIWLFIVPLAFIYFMGFAARGPGAPENHRPTVAIENLDTNFLGRIFLEELGAQGLKVVSPTNAGTSAQVLRIPADFTTRVLQGKPAKIDFAQRRGSAETDGALIELRLLRSLVAINSHLIEAISTHGPASALDENSLRARMRVADRVTFNAHFAGRKPVPSGFNFSLPGNLVMYLMMNLLIFGGNLLAAERRNGVLKRLACHPLSQWQIVMGKIYGLMLLAAVQIAFLLAVGRLVLHVNLGANLPAVALTLGVYAWVAGSLGVLIGSLVSTEDRITGICVLASLMMAALGGCWWPLEISPTVCQTIALCLPSGWAMQALHQLISFGGGLEDVLLPLAVLLGFGAVFNFLAIRFFRP